MSKYVAKFRKDREYSDDRNSMKKIGMRVPRHRNENGEYKKVMLRHYEEEHFDEEHEGYEYFRK